MKPIKLTDAQMDAALGLESDEMDHEKTGNRKCWHVLDLRDKIIEHEHLTLIQAKQLSHVPHRGYCRDGFKLVQCDGEAHDNPNIDNCMQCAPRWGWVMVPIGRINVCEDCKRECADGELSTMGLCPQCKPGGKPELTHVEKTLLGALK